MLIKYKKNALTLLMPLFRLKDNLNKIKIILSLIESIRSEDKTIYIKTNKNIVLEHEAHIVSIAKGYSIHIAKELHLCPNINIKNDRDMGHIEEEIKDMNNKRIMNER